MLCDEIILYLTLQLITILGGMQITISGSL